MIKRQYRIFHTEPKDSIDGKHHYRILYKAPKKEQIGGYETWLDATGKSYSTLASAEKVLAELKKG